MKLQGMAGKGSGKLGSQVYAISGGEQIVRQYNGEVTNPSTDAQVETRSKFKLLSQLAAALSPVIAIKKQGLVSGRNQFMQINQEYARYTDNDASINLNKVQITKSNRGLDDFEADRSGGTSIVVKMYNNVSASVDKMVYSAFKKNLDGSLTIHDTQVVTEAGEDGKFQANLSYTASSVIIYAYGIKLTNSAAQSAFGNMVVPTAEQVAKLLTTSSEAANGSQATRTKALTMNEGEDTGSSDSEEHFVVSVTASGNGSVRGGGSYVAGQMATLTATPDAEASFVAWKRGSASGAVLSTNATYTFEVTDNITIVGVFQGGPTPHYNIAASVNPSGYGSVSGTGSKEEGTTCTLVATPAEGKRFLNWTENGTIVSTSASYTFTVQNARTLVANFEDAPASGFSNVQFDHNAWNQNLQSQNSGQHSVAGNFVTEQSYDKIGFVRKSSSTRVAPIIGEQVALLSELTVQSGEFTGNVNIGSDAPVSVQSMCNTDSRDISATLRQIDELAERGCEIIRLAVLN